MYIVLASAAVPPSILPGLPPRLARVVFSGAFAASGMAIREGDEWNGASIATCEFSFSNPSSSHHHSVLIRFHRVVRLPRSAIFHLQSIPQGDGEEGSENATNYFLSICVGAYHSDHCDWCCIRNHIIGVWSSHDIQKSFPFSLIIILLKPNF
jgi:hypothetical protein